MHLWQEYHRSDTGSLRRFLSGSTMSWLVPWLVSGCVSTHLITVMSGGHVHHKNILVPFVLNKTLVKRHFETIWIARLSPSFWITHSFTYTNMDWCVAVLFSGLFVSDLVSENHFEVSSTSFWHTPSLISGTTCAKFIPYFPCPHLPFFLSSGFFQWGMVFRNQMSSFFWSVLAPRCFCWTELRNMWLCMCICVHTHTCTHRDTHTDTHADISTHR